jgi:UPF0755 protein
MKKNCFSIGAISFCIFAITIVVGLLLFVLIYFPQSAKALFGEPSSGLSTFQKITYPVRLVLGEHALLDPADASVNEKNVTITQGESVDSIAAMLQQSGLITNPELFRIYLIYSGLDRGIQAGQYTINATANAIEIGKMLQDATPKEVHFVILAGWRAEEISASLETSGLKISQTEFLNLVKNPSFSDLPQQLTGLSNLEGFMLPGDYLIPRESNVSQLLKTIIDQFSTAVTPEMLQAYQNQGLSLGQAVTLASMIQREAIQEEEMPMIASVFLNRLSVGMKFDSDATVQYALGYDSTQKTWWKNPLTINDLNVDSHYNTYLYNGFPPGPICNPGIAALKAVAYPTQSSYYYFRAKCDKSGFHNFAETFEQQQQNACP